MTNDKTGRRFTAFELLRYVGPGLLVTIGFIDPGNWASNIAAGAAFGYRLLWVLTLGTLFLVLLQHNAAHLGIATGLCLSEAVTQHLPRTGGRLILGSAAAATVSTALAEILGAGIALHMLFRIPVRVGAVLAAAFVAVLLATNSYRYIERWLIGFVALIGLAFLYELTLVDVPWREVAAGWVTPAIPSGSILLIMSVLGAVVMPHNLFLHSEIIQSRRWDLEDDRIIRRQLKFEFVDTIFSMGVGWVINSALMIIAAATFFARRLPVEDLAQAEVMLRPLLGRAAQVVFAAALLFAGLASTVTAAMTGGTISAGAFGRGYDLKDRRSQAGVGLTLVLALIAVFLLEDTFRALLLSQMFLSVQLPVTIFTMIALTSSKTVMGRFVNAKRETILLVVVGTIVVGLNILLLLGAVGLF